MDAIDSTIEEFVITFKFGGYWREVNNSLRRRFDGGKQKTVKLEKEKINFDVLNKKTEAICPWLKGHCFDLYYYIHGTSPKDYKLITSDEEVLQMIAQSCGYSRTEIVVTTQDSREEGMYSEGREIMDVGNILENYQSNEYCTYEDLYVGACFPDSKTFKQVLRSRAIICNFGVKIISSNKSRVIAICSYKGCPWRIRASICRDGQTFEVKRLETIHLCPGVNRAGNKQATIAWVAEEVQDLVKKNPDITPKDINNNLEATYGLSLPYMKLWRSRELAKDNIFGSVDDNYKWVPTLRAELLKSNPGSHIIYTYSSHDYSFKRFFVSFKVCVDGFLTGCRRLIGLDACHLKSKFLGVLLSANCLDGNNGLFTLAFAVAESESKKTWLWFLQNLFEAIGTELQHTSYISDMEKGLLEAMKIVFPNVEHRVCLRHLWKNLKKYFHCKDTHKIKSLVWSAANVYTKHEFDVKMTELANTCPQVHSYLASLPYCWCRSDFSIDIKNHYNTNNMSESFNSWIGEARTKPVVDLIDTIRGMLMEQRAERKFNSTLWRGELVPHAEDYIREVTTRREQFIVRQSSPNIAQVEGSKERHVVDIGNRKCSCNFWQIVGLPCIHVVAFIGTKEYRLWHTYVDEHYHIMRYKMAYEGSISALPSKEQWTIVDVGLQIGVPNTLRPRGRPKKRRFKNFLESNHKKSKSTHKCSRCGMSGHHKNTCKNPLNQTSDVRRAEDSEI